MLTSSHLFKEIHEQPEVIQRLLETSYKSVQQLGQAILSRHIDHVVIAARGTSDNAGIYAKYILGAINGLTVSLATPSLYTIYQRPPKFGNALLLGISQSGKSPDIVAVLAEARRQGVLTAVITNSPGSDLAKESDFIIDLNAGEEKSVAATKTYTAELASLALLSAVLAPDKTLLDELKAIPEAVAATLSMNEEIISVAPRYRYMDSCVVIGRGYNYATAFEMALKMKELTYSVVQPYSSADFLHGPMALIEHGFPVIVIAPAGMMEGVMGTFVQELNKNMAEVIAISDVASVLQVSKILLPLPHSVPEWLSPLTTIIPGQLLSLHLAHERGFDVDSPRSLKKVTETH
jgi:glucosamine--fructose-6-phosphate aminotransferase (isomerizing)